MNTIDSIKISNINNIIKLIGNRTKQQSAIKIYNFLYTKYLNSNDEYFEIKSIDLKKINSRYKSIIDYFIEYKIIDYYRITPYNKGYNGSINLCMKYRFLIE